MLYHLVVLLFKYKIILRWARLLSALICHLVRDDSALFLQVYLTIKLGFLL